MSKLTLDEAIKHCLDVAEEQELSADDKEMYSEMLGEDYKGFEEGCLECAADHSQLAEWLMELKDARGALNDCGVEIEMLLNELREAKRLLKAAVKDMKILVRCDSVQDCLVCKYQLGNCDGFAFEWKHMEDVNNLINPIE